MYFLHLQKKWTKMFKKMIFWKKIYKNETGDINHKKLLKKRHFLSKNIGISLYFWFQMEISKMRGKTFLDRKW